MRFGNIDENAYYGNRLSNQKATEAWKSWIKKNRLYAYFIVNSHMNLGKLLQQGNAHYIAGDSGLDLAIDHARIYKQKKTGATILLSHYYDFAEPSFKKVKEYCAKNDLALIPFSDSWYYPGVAHAFALVATKNKENFTYP